MNRIRRAEKKRNQKVCEGEERIKMFGFCSDHGRKLDAKERRRGRKQAFINYTTITLLYPPFPPCLHVAAGV
jgi:predicted nucleic acid-binding Zn ribbon protein